MSSDIVEHTKKELMNLGQFLDKFAPEGRQVIAENLIKCPPCSLISVNTFESTNRI